MPRRKQSQANESASEADEHEKPAKLICRPHQALESCSKLSSSNNIFCTTVHSKCETSQCSSCTVKGKKTNILPSLKCSFVQETGSILVPEENEIKVVIDPAKCAIVEEVSKSEVVIDAEQHRTVVTVTCVSSTPNHKQNQKNAYTRRNLPQNGESTNVNFFKKRSTNDSGNAKEKLTQSNNDKGSSVDHSDRHTLVYKQCWVQECDTGLCVMSEDNSSGTNSKLLKSSIYVSGEETEITDTNVLLSQAKSSLMNAESPITVGEVLPSNFSVNHCRSCNSPEENDRGKENKSANNTIGKVFAVTVGDLTNQEMMTTITERMAGNILQSNLDRSLVVTTNSSLPRMTSALSEVTVISFNAAHGASENSTLMSTTCDTVGKTTNTEMCSQKIMSSLLMPSSIYGPPVESPNVESVLHGLRVNSISSEIKPLTEVSSLKLHTETSESSNMSSLVKEKKRDEKPGNQNVTIKNYNASDELACFRKEDNFPSSKKLRLKIPDTKVSELSSLSEGAVASQSQGISPSIKSVKSPVVTSPQILEERISKLISENAAIVETLDPLWSWRYTRQSSISSSQNIESELKNVKTSVRMRRYSEDSSLAKKVHTSTNVDQCFASKLQVALMGNGVTESCEINDRVTGSSEELSPLHINVERMSVLEKINIKEDSFHEHPRNPERSIIKDLLLKDRSKGEKSLLDSVAIKKPLAIETVTKSPQVSFLCKLCNIVFRCKENFIVHQQHYCKGIQEYNFKSEESLHYLKGDISPSKYMMALPISSSSAASASQSSKSNTSVYSLFQHGQVSPSYSEAHIQIPYHGLTSKSHIFQKSTISPPPENPPLKKRKISEPANGSEGVVKNKSLSYLSDFPQTSQQLMLMVTSTKPSDVQMKDLRENTQICDNMLVHPIQVNTGLSVIQEIPNIKKIESVLKDYSMLPKENIATSVVTISKPVLNSGGTVLSVQNSVQDEVNSEISLQSKHITEMDSVFFALSNSKMVAHKEINGKTFPNISLIKVDEPKDAEIIQDLSLSKLVNTELCFKRGVSVPTTLHTSNLESVPQSMVSVQRKASTCSFAPDSGVMQGRPDTNVSMDLLKEMDSISSDSSMYMQASFSKMQSVPERPVLSPPLPFFPSSVMHLVLENNPIKDIAQLPLHQSVSSTLSFNLASKSPPDIPTSDKPLPVPCSTERIIANNSFQIENPNVEASKTKPTRPSSLPLKKKVITMIGSTLISPETPRPKKHCIQQYINGHSYTYLGLKCSTRSTYCSIYRPQPMYVPQDTDPKLSMYSNWQVVPAKNMLLGLSPGQMIGLYDSRQWLHSCSGILALAKQSPQLLITHSSYWVYRCQELEKSSKTNHILSSPIENKFEIYQSKTEQSASDSIEIVNLRESKEKTSFNSLESVISSGLYSCIQRSLMVSTPDESKHFVKAQYQEEQLNVTNLSKLVPNGNKQSINMLNQNHSLSKPDNLLVSPSSEYQLLYSQLTDQQLHILKSQECLINSGTTKQSFTNENEKQQQCSGKFTKYLISSSQEHPISSKDEEGQQNQTESQGSPVSPYANKQALNLYCRNEELNLSNTEKQLFNSPEIQYSIITPDQEEQPNITKPGETMISPNRKNPTHFYQNQDEQVNSSMSVSYPERNKHLELVSSSSRNKQVSNNQEVCSTISSMDSSSLSVNPETLQSPTTSSATLLPALSPLCSGEAQPSLKTVSNSSLSPTRPGGQEGESDETSDSFHTIKLTELTTDEESTRSEPLNDNESAILPKRVRIFEGGFKSNEDYTYVRGRGRGKYVCEECGIRCKKPSMLKKHIRTHTDLRPFSCSHCSFAFKTKGNLTKHMKSKAHHKKCVELGIVPVPTTVDDSQIDGEALAKQEQLDKERRQFIDGEELEDDEDEDFDDDAGDSYGEEDAEMEILSDERPINDQKTQQNNEMPGEKCKDSEEQKHEAAHCLLNLSSLPTITNETKDEQADDVTDFSLQENLQLQATIPDSKEDCTSKNLIPQNNNVTAVSLLLTPPLQHRSRSSSVHIPLSPARKQDMPTLMENQVINQSTCFTKESAGNRRYSFSVVGELRRNIHLSENQRIDSEQLSIKSENQGQCLDFPSFSSVPLNCEDETSISGTDQPMDLSVTRGIKIDPKASVDNNSGVPEEPLDSLLGACLQYGSLTALRTGGSQMVLNLSEAKRQSQSPWDFQQQIVSRPSVDDSMVQLSPVTPPSPNEIPSKTFLHDDQSPTSCKPQAEFIVAKSGCRQNLDDGKCVCDICNKTFTKPSQLRLHVNIHYFERPFRCDSCVVSFRTKGHLQKHKRSVSHYNKVNMNQTFGTPSADNPRPFKCSDCKIAFRIHGHLAKHLRSKMHIMKLECLGRLPFGMYAEMERNGTNLNEIDTTDGDSSLESLQAIAQRLYLQEPRQHTWQQENTHGVAECSSYALSSSDSICVSLSQNKKLTAPITNNFQIKQEPQDAIDSHSLKNEGDSILWSVDFKKVESSFSDQNTQLHHHPLSCQLCGQSFVSAKTLRVHTYYHHAQWSTDGATSSTTLRPVSPVICGKSPQTTQKCASRDGLQQPTAFLCQVCGHACAAAQDLQKHVQIHHRDPP